MVVNTLLKAMSDDNKFIPELNQMATKEVIKSFYQVLDADIETLKKAVEYIANRYMQAADMEALDFIKELLGMIPARFSPEGAGNTKPERVINEVANHIVRIIHSKTYFVRNTTYGTNSIVTRERGLISLLNDHLINSLFKKRPARINFNEIVSELGKALDTGATYMAIAAMETAYALEEIGTGAIKEISLNSARKSEVRLKALKMIASDKKNLGHPTRELIEIIITIANQHKGGDWDTLDLFAKASGVLGLEKELFEPLSAYVAIVLLASDSEELLKMGQLTISHLMYNFPKEADNVINETLCLLDEKEKKKVKNIIKKHKKYPHQTLKDITPLPFSYYHAGVAATSLLGKMNSTTS